MVDAIGIEPASDDVLNDYLTKVITMVIDKLIDWLIDSPRLCQRQIDGDSVK